MDYEEILAQVLLIGRQAGRVRSPHGSRRGRDSKRRPFLGLHPESVWLVIRCTRSSDGLEEREWRRVRDEGDWPVLASCATWSEDADFFGTGAAVSTTNALRFF